MLRGKTGTYSMSNSHEASSSFGVLIQGVRKGDQEAAVLFWRRYWPRLLQLADRRMARYRRQEADEEDVVLSALRTFMRRAELGQFEGLRNEPSLWNLLSVILARKIYAHHRRQTSEKRDHLRQKGLNEDSVFDDAAIDEQVIFGETLKRLLEAAGEKVEPYVLMRLEGYTHEEIAQILKVSSRTVERRLSDARKAWQQIELDGD